MPDQIQPNTQKKQSPLIPLFRLLGIITIMLVMGFSAYFLSGILSGISSNIVNQDGITYFDPLITLTYLVFFYFLNHFFTFTNKQRTYYFLFTLLLSYTISFVEGSLILLALFPVLRFLKLIEKE